MKKRNLLCILPLLVTFTSCENKSSIDKNNVIQSILNGVNVKIKGEENVVYPDEYSYLNTINYIDIERDYKTLVEEDGTKTPIVREKSGSSFSTYLRGEDGQAIFEVLNSNNEVTALDYEIGQKQILYNEYFANPFEYIDSEDIGDDCTLDLAKASLIVENYTGLNYAVKSAKFVVEDNVAKSLKIELHDKINGLITSSMSLSIKYSLNLSIDFAYDILNLEHLTPREISDDALKSAFVDKDNFTMTFQSDATEETAIVYVTDNMIYVHNDIDAIGTKDGDVLYKKSSADEYLKYVYSDSKNAFSLEDFNIKRSKILPTLENVSPNILLKSSDNVYYFDKIASVNGLEKMILPSYAVTSGNGIEGTLKLKDGEISSLYAKFNQNNPFYIQQNYFNYGKTTLPLWFDSSLI